MSLIIRFHKQSHDTHILEIIRSNGASEQVTCETKSYLGHDLLHFAVESEAGIQAGFWGNLAKGKTLADMNDRTGASMKDELPDMAMIEQTVGMLTGAVKGVDAEEMMHALERYATSLGTTLPPWLTVPYIKAVQERMRQLIGHWNGTPYGQIMELEWKGERSMV